nr:hypothetical protein [Mycolicibacterium fortuitum]
MYLIRKRFPNPAEDEGQQLAGVGVIHLAPLRRTRQGQMVEADIVAASQPLGELEGLEPRDLAGCGRARATIGASLHTLLVGHY